MKKKKKRRKHVIIRIPINAIGKFDAAEFIRTHPANVRDWPEFKGKL